MPNFTLPAGQWVEISTVASSAIIQRSGGVVAYAYSATEPAGFDQTTPIVANTSHPGDDLVLPGMPAGISLWARAVNVESIITVTRFDAAGIPAEAFTGNRAINIQFYDESNKKLGAQFEASALFESLGLNAEVLTTFTTGSLPVDLKRREFAFSGLGIEARIHKDPVNVQGGSVVPLFNMRDGFPQPLTSLVSGVTVSSKGTEIAAPIYAIGPGSTVAKGSSNYPYAANRILEPNTTYLLTVKSLDASQDVSGRIEFYEGLLDLPIT